MSLASSGMSKIGAGRKRKAVNINRLNINERTTREHKRLLEISVLDQIGLSQNTIAKKLGLCSQTVGKYLKKQREYFPHLKDVDAYKINKSKLIDAVESKALQSISLGLERPDVALKDSTLAFKILHQAGRLESNQSTANVDNRVQFSMTPLSNAKDS